MRSYASFTTIQSRNYQAHQFKKIPFPSQDSSSHSYASLPVDFHNKPRRPCNDENDRKHYSYSSPRCRHEFPQNFCSSTTSCNKPSCKFLLPFHYLQPHRHLDFFVFVNRQVLIQEISNPYSTPAFISSDFTASCKFRMGLDDLIIASLPFTPFSTIEFSISALELFIAFCMFIKPIVVEKFLNSSIEGSCNFLYIHY